MARCLFREVHVIDGTGAEPFAGDVLVDGNRIAEVATAPGTLVAPDAVVVDGAGRTLMPGLTDAHTHLSFLDIGRMEELAEVPPEEHLLATLKFARVVLDHGYTSCFSGASAKPRIDVVVRNAIEAGDFAGPRLRAATKQMTVSGGFGDFDQLHFSWGDGAYAVVLNGPEAFRDYTREACREGVDVIKIVPSAMGRGPLAEDTVMSDAEVGAVCEVARQRGRKVAAHARSAEAVKMCVRNGVDVIYHATFADDEAKDMLEAARERVVVAPAMALLWTRLHDDSAEIDPPIRARLEQELEIVSATMTELRQRGVRVLPGGDYGFRVNPHGTNARDLAYMVDLFGCSPTDAIVAATQWGGELMGLAGELGTVQPGWLADLLLVDGNPLDDIAILQDRDRLVAIMKDGAFHKAPPAAPDRWREAAE